MKSDIQTQLAALAHRLGQPQADYVILGEGNVAAKGAPGRFFVTQSGAALATLTLAQIVEVREDAVMALLKQDALTDEAVRTALSAAKVDGTLEPRPSVETLLHAVCLNEPGVAFVAHTHPTAINIITCSKFFADAVSGRLFPDEIVVAGVAPAIVPYVDPGTPLAQEVARRLTEYRTVHRRRPKAILLQNHGLVALGETADEVEQITAMMVKAARVLIGTYALGGPHFLSDDDVRRIDERLDEQYRRAMLRAPRAG